MKVLVVGGTRFFGKTLVEQLLTAGHAVTVLSRGKLPAPAGAEHLVADRADPAALRGALDGRSFDAVVDNVAMTAAHVRGALDALGDRAGHYLLTSSISAYGEFTRGHVWREDELGAAELALPPADGHPYTVGKRGAELLLLKDERPRVPFTILRPGYVVGPHDHLRRMQFFVRRVKDGGPVVIPSGASDVFQLAWHADVAAAIARAIGDAKTFGRAYNLVGRDVFTYPLLVRALAEVAGVATPCVEVPRALLRRGVLAGQELPFGEEDAMWVCDTARAERDLGVAPTPATTWLSELCAAPLPAPSPAEEAERVVERARAQVMRRFMPAAPSRLRR